MGCINEQIKKRMDGDEASFQHAFADLCGAATGDRLLGGFSTDRDQALRALKDVFACLHIELIRVSGTYDNFDACIEHALKQTGVMRRRVKLKGTWYRDASGPMLGTLKTGQVVALVPGGFSSYRYRDPDSGRYVRVGIRNADFLDEEAWCFYKPFPARSLTLPDLVRYMLSHVTGGDTALFLGVAALVTLVGLFTPYVSKYLFGKVIPGGHEEMLLPIVVMLISFTIGSKMMTVAQNFAGQRLSTRINLAVEPAAMMRLLSLPSGFFRNYDAGDLSSRLTQLTTLCSNLVSTATSAVILAVFSVAYLVQIHALTPTMSTISVITLLALAVVNLIAGALSRRLARRVNAADVKLNGIMVALLRGIEKIKMTGSEKRAYSKWAAKYSEKCRMSYALPWLVKYSQILSTLISLVGSLAFYICALKSHLSVADYIAFTSAYGFVSGAILSLAGLSSTLAGFRPQLEMVAPLLHTCPETAEGKTIVKKLQGGIELSHVCFRYDENGEKILKDISVNIHPGQYIGIVGRSGCGKSTLIRLLLGLEQPVKGTIYFDGMDMSRLDVRSVRKHIGTVTQDSQLFTGNIFYNIAITTPNLTKEEAWEALRAADFEDDVREMPMGLNTVISEGGGLSGGQRQRLIIARAIASHPSILIMDEATSALDNITQRHISDSLRELKCTRIAVAHRLSTIQDCDRILVLDGGKIIEDGTYEQLLEQRGSFYDLVQRQLLEQ